MEKYDLVIIGGGAVGFAADDIHEACFQIETLKPWRF